MGGWVGGKAVLRDCLPQSKNGRLVLSMCPLIRYDRCSDSVQLPFIRNDASTEVRDAEKSPPRFHVFQGQIFVKIVFCEKRKRTIQWRSNYRSSRYLNGGKLSKCRIHWGSEYRTCPVFEWSKVVRSLNGTVFKWYLNTGLKVRYS